MKAFVLSFGAAISALLTPASAQTPNPSPRPVVVDRDDKVVGYPADIDHIFIDVGGGAVAKVPIQADGFSSIGRPLFRHESTDCTGPKYFAANGQGLPPAATVNPAGTRLQYPVLARGREVAISSIGRGSDCQRLSPPYVTFGYPSVAMNTSDLGIVFPIRVEIR